MARRPRFHRLGEHHLGVDVEFSPKDETERSLILALGAAEDVDILKASLKLPLYQIKRSAHDVLIRHGVPKALFDDVTATFTHVQTRFDSDTEPHFAANLLVAIGALEMREDPRFLAGALYMFAALKPFYEMRREFSDGPAIARDAAGVSGRSDGGNNKRTNAAVWLDSRNRRIITAFQHAKCADPGLSENDWAKDPSHKWLKTEDGEDVLKPRSIREILSRARILAVL
jgi:hypothetical protein